MSDPSLRFKKINNKGQGKETCLVFLAFGASEGMRLVPYYIRHGL